MMSEAPPPYSELYLCDDPGPSADRVSISLPRYTPLLKYGIGTTTTTQPLVNISQIKGHLALLHKFTELKRRVDSTIINVPYVPEDNERKWVYFVGLAVERFDLWCRAIDASDSSKDCYVVLPPIDVLMVWHSYMLNPRWYAEDCMRLNACQNLKGMEPHFRQLLLDPFVVIEPPFEPRVDFWRSTTGLQFDLLEDISNMNSRAIPCPMCDRNIRVALMNERGTGYLQRGFTATCYQEGCTSMNREINKEQLALAKIARDLATKSSHLAGTLLVNVNSEAEQGSEIKRIACHSAKELLRSHTPPVNGSHEHQESYLESFMFFTIMRLCRYSLRKLAATMGAVHYPLLVGRILSAYNDDKIYSLDPVGAVLRQGSFVGKMYDLGWTAPGFFDGLSDELALKHAQVRYHAFLDLIITSPVSNSLFVPTLDIDLICMKHLKRFIDHDDKVEEDRLSSAFNSTCRAWKDRFRVEYTHCGCPVAGDTIGQRLSHIVGIFLRRAERSSSLVPLNRPDILLATHPSDHNAVRPAPRTRNTHTIASRKYTNSVRKWQQERETQAAKTAGKASNKISTMRTTGDGYVHHNHSRPSLSLYTHDAAFLVPVPVFYGEGPQCVAACGSTVTT